MKVAAGGTRWRAQEKTGEVALLKRNKDVRRIPTSAVDVGAELAVMAFSVTVVYGFARLFADLSFFVPIATVAITSHVISIAVRWAGGGLLAATSASMVGFAATAWLLFPPTTIVGDVPISGSTLSAYGTDLGLAWDQFQSVSAPAEVTAPFLLLVAMVMWTVAFLGDWAAFRLQSPAESLIPGFAVFVFGAFFSSGEARIITTGALVVASMLVILFHRSSETIRSTAWLGEGAAKRGERSLLRVGAAILAVTLVGGVSVAQALPGYDEPAIENFDPTTWDEPEEPRVVLSPLVDIQSRLVDQPDVEVFRVQSPTRDYWRLTSLDVFDGQIWRSRGSFQGADGGLEGNLPDGTVVQTVEQTFDVGALAQIWLPAAYEPTDIVDAPDDIELEYEADSGTLIVNRETESSDGLQYTLLSRVPLRDAAGVEAIRTAGDNVPGEIAERYLGLPEDFSPRVTELAQTVIADAGAESPYDKALALQNSSVTQHCSPTASKYRAATADPRSRTSSSKYTPDIASSSPDHSPPWPDRSAFPHESLLDSPQATSMRQPTNSSSPASTHTHGPRFGSTALGGSALNQPQDEVDPATRPTPDNKKLKKETSQLR